MPFPSGWELVLVLLVILVLFGAKRLPDSARALGRSMRILKAETKGMREDGAADARRDTTVTAEPLPPVVPPPAGGAPHAQSQAPYSAPPSSSQPSGAAGLGDQTQQPRP